MRSISLKFFTFNLQSGTFFRTPSSLSIYMTAISPWSPKPVAKATTLQSKPHHYLSEGTPMIGNYSARLTGSKRNLLALLASSLVFSAGCSNMSSTAPAVNSLSTAATLSGKVHGGNQPVSGATVTLWFAGQGAPAILAATTTTDSSGSFTFLKDSLGGHNGTTNSWSCPATGGSPLVYVLSQGGNTQNNGVVGQTNDAAAFIALYGDCPTITGSNFVYMSEATTVATMAAVQQFFNPADHTLRADSTGQQRLVMLNLPNTVAILADASTGLANASKVIPATTVGSIAGGVTVTATPESLKINTLANIISACVNGATSAAPACGTLFSAAAPPIPNTTSLNGGNFPQATDTLQALFYIFTNPANGNSTSSTNLSTLFGLQPATGAPFVPSLSAQPTDWTIGISYASNSTCGSTGGFISSPNDINIDSLDNVWFGNAQAGGNLSSISAAGQPLYCVNFDPGTSASGGTIDAYSPSGTSFNPNVWFAAGTTMYRYNPSSKTTLAFPVGVSPLAITADGAGNVYFTAVTGTTGSLYMLPAAAGASAAVAPVQISNTVGPNPARLMADNQTSTPRTTPGNIWVSSGSTFVSQVSQSSASGNLNGWSTTPFTTSGNSYGLSISAAGNIFTSAIDTGAVTLLARTATSWVIAGGFPYTGTAGISAPTGIAVDGRSNTWIPNSGSPSVSEISFFGPNSLSPSTGFQKDPTFLNASNAVAVDQAGNVWVAGTGNNFITEIVGGAVPMYQPYAIGIAIGRFQAIP
jgi:sugar lactone lactonase YvrE